MIGSIRRRTQAIRSQPRPIRQGCPVSVGSVVTRFGPVTVAATDEAVILVSFCGKREEPQFFRRVTRLIPEAEIAKQNQLVTAALRQILEYSQGKRRGFEMPYELYTTPFRRKILSAVSAIPFGTVATYGDIARVAGHRRAVRACGSANAQNTLPLLIPCHRVVAAGGIGGYGGRVDLKRRLLEHEGYLNFSLQQPRKRA